MGELKLRSSDQLKLEIVYKVSAGKLGSREAQQVLKVSERTLRRYVRAYRDRGISFIEHGNKRREPANKIDAAFRRKITGLIKEKYFDFNICHLQEALFAETGLKLSYSTLRRWCHEIQLVKNRQKRRSKPRKVRQRMSQEGHLLQLDGSHHYWFGGRFLCLMAAIDDATSEVFAEFYEGETSWACLDFLHKIVRKKGAMSFTYTDRAGLYGGTKRENFSQVERALGEIGTHVIYAHSPEGKGRVERLFKTLQDRLVAELRLHGINQIAEANRYLKEIYLPKHNAQFMVKPHNEVSAYRFLPADIDLANIFCIKQYRVVARDHTVSIKGERWMIADQLKYSISGQKIELRFDKWDDWKARFAGREITLVRIKNAKKVA